MYKPRNVHITKPLLQHTSHSKLEQAATMGVLWVKLLLLVCCGFLLLPQPIHSLRIKRADNLTNTATAGTMKTEPIPVASIKPQVEIAKQTAAASTANVSAVPAPVATATAKEKLQLQEQMPLPLDLAERIYRTKRRPSLKEEETLLHKANHQAGHSPRVAGPPFVYYNKMLSPDGKQEVKEFQLLAPNVVIESVQRDVNYGPEMGGVLLLNADNSRMHGLTKPKHHHKHKSSLALPPFLYLLQQLLQPNLNLDMELPQTARNRIDTPIYQFLDTAVDNALQNNNNNNNNREMIDRMQTDHYHDEIMDKDKEHDGDTNELSSQKIELSKEDKSKDELLVSCPIHHEHHAAANGEAIDEDVVLVNECHIV